MRRELKRDGGACVKCGARERLQVDHIVALRDGGNDVRSNLQVLCQPCHAAKSKAEATAGRHRRMRQVSGIEAFTRGRGGPPSANPPAPKSSRRS